MAKKCDRCSGSLKWFLDHEKSTLENLVYKDMQSDISRMSWFNEDMVCMPCAHIETKHPMYAEAREEERKSWSIDRNFNFAGIGAPSDLVADSIAAKEKREPKEAVSENN